jgi:hypothetical protein
VRAGGAAERYPQAAQSANTIGLVFVRDWGGNLPEQLMLATADAESPCATTFTPHLIVEAPTIQSLNLAPVTGGFAILYGHTTELADASTTNTQSLVWEDQAGNVLAGPSDVNVGNLSECTLSSHLYRLLVACLPYSASSSALQVFLCGAGGSCEPCSIQNDLPWASPAFIAESDTGWDLLAYAGLGTGTEVVRLRLSQQCQPTGPAQILASNDALDYPVMRYGLGPAFAAMRFGGLLWVASEGSLSAYDDNGNTVSGPFAVSVAQGLTSKISLAGDKDAFFITDNVLTHSTVNGSSFAAQLTRVDRADPTQQTPVSLPAYSLASMTAFSINGEMNLAWTEGSGLMLEPAAAVLAGARPAQPMFGNLGSATAVGIQSSDTSSAIFAAEPTTQDPPWRAGFWQVNRENGTVSAPTATVGHSAYADQMSFEPPAEAAMVWGQSNMAAPWDLSRLKIDGTVEKFDIASLGSADVEIAIDDAGTIHLVQEGADYKSLQEYTLTQGGLSSSRLLESGYFAWRIRACAPGYVAWLYTGQLANNPLTVMRFEVEQAPTTLFALNRGPNLDDQIIDFVCSTSQIGVFVLERTWVNQLAQDTYSLQVYDPSGTPITVVDVTGINCVAHASDGQRLYWVLDDPANPHAFSLIGLGTDGSVTRQRLDLPSQVTRAKFTYPGGYPGCDGNALELSASEVRLVYRDIYGNLRLGIWPR